VRVCRAISVGRHHVVRDWHCELRCD
jgi:hypothetical protein